MLYKKGRSRLEGSTIGKKSPELDQVSPSGVTTVGDSDEAQFIRGQGRQPKKEHSQGEMRKTSRKIPGGKGTSESLG